MSVDTTGSGAEIASAGHGNDWFSDFWTNVFQDKALTESQTASLSGLSGQLYQQFAEAVRVNNRHTIPEGERRRWQLFTLREDQCDASPVNAVRLGAGITLGVQANGAYVEGAVPRVGGHLPLTGFTAYPLDSRCTDIAVIVDVLRAPGHVLVRDVDFQLRADSILFRDGSDPFELGFPARTVMRDGVEIREVAVWARDAIMDADLAHRFAGYVLGERGVSSPWYLRYVNALWNLAQSGGTEAALARFVYTAADVPFATADGDVVEYVGPDGTGAYTVITSGSVYTGLAEATIRVVPGDVLAADEPITTLVRIVDTREALASGAAFVVLGGTGLSAAVADSAIVYAGSDENGNPRLRFELAGSADAVSEFWERTDSFCSSNAVDQAAVMSPHLFDYRPPVAGAAWGRVSPARFLVDCGYGNSARFVLVNWAGLTADGATGIYRMAAAEKYLPVGMRLQLAVQVSAHDIYEADTVDAPAVYALEAVPSSGVRVYEAVSTRLVPLCKGGMV